MRPRHGYITHGLALGAWSWLRRGERERQVLLLVWSLAVAGCGLGAVPAQAGGPNFGPSLQALAVLRVVCTTALAVTIILGPGLAARALFPGRFTQLGFLPLPGIGLLTLGGTLAWVVGIAGWVHPRLICTVVFATALIALPSAINRSENGSLLSPSERGVLLLAGAALGIAIGRGLWSLGPAGELYSGTVYRTLEVGGRPDSRISYEVVAIAAHGAHPYGSISAQFFFPYTFSSRGPIAGLASLPIVMLAGGHPPTTFAAKPWGPFDPQGFMSYRLTMMTLATSCVLAVWTVSCRLADQRTARFVVLLATSTPFLVHEIWFTWPKLLAASLVLLAAVRLSEGRRIQAGVLIAAAYLSHPVALLSVPSLCLLALWPHARPAWRRPKLPGALLFVASLGACLFAWRLANGSHFGQGNFLSYFKAAGNITPFNRSPVTIASWIDDRAVSVGNTLVPLRQFLQSSHNPEVNPLVANTHLACFPFCPGTAPWVTHFFFQYWTGVPFGLAIVFWPALVYSTWRAMRLWPWPVIAGVIFPFVLFAVYWGGPNTGMMREGLHPWVLCLLIMVAVQQRADGFRYLRHRWLRVIIALRAGEVLATAMVPTVATTGRLISGEFWLSDTVAVTVMLALGITLALCAWRAVDAEPTPTMLAA